VLLTDAGEIRTLDLGALAYEEAARYPRLQGSSHAASIVAFHFVFGGGAWRTTTAGVASTHPAPETFDWE